MRKAKKSSPLAKALQVFSETAVPAIDKLSGNEAASRTADSAAALDVLRASIAPLHEALNRRLDELRKRLEACDLSSVSNSKVRRQIAPFGDEACILLANLLSETETLPIRQIAARGLSLLGTRGSDAISALTVALNSDDELLRTVAALALKQMGPKAMDAIPALTEALKIEGLYWNQGVVEALLAIAPRDPRTVSALAGSLRSKNRNNRILALWALGHIGPRAISICPALRYELERFAKGEENLSEEAMAILRKLRAP